MSVAELERPAPEEQATEPAPAPAVPLFTIAASSFLASAAAAWAAGGLFGGALARAAALLAAAAGTAIVVTGQRTGRPGAVQAAGVPVVVGLAFLFSLTASEGGVADAVREALQGGGPSGEALSFDAGWRFLLVLLLATLAAGACGLALMLGSARAGVLVPVPPLVGAALVQPKGAMLTSGLPAMVLLLAALVVSYGAALAAEGASSGRFEARRVTRGAIAIVVIAGLLFGISRANSLFPVPDQERVIPPRLPPDVPPTPDRVLFDVRTRHPGPWRLGVLDVYDGRAWLLPPYDPARLQPVATDGTVPGAAAGPSVPVRFAVRAMSGPVLPSVASPRRMSPPHGARYDPRTGVLRLASGRSQNGLGYTVQAPAPATGRDLAEAPPPPAALREFLSVPPMPPRVGLLLADAPAEPLWDRLQYARAAYYRAVVASGAGKPVAVPPARVDEILTGDPASPYEITAAEALLARWAGIPSRIGYGFFRGESRGGALEVRPRHAATWLEVYFEGHGWVPVVGVPPRAQASLREDRQQDPEIRPSEQLALVLYVPVEQQTIRLFYVLARYWVLVSLPFVLALAGALVFYPGALKLARASRRRRWASRRGPRTRVAAAYAELRDAATDLGIGDPSQTPMEFARAVADDEELTELSWLVSRALWGDLVRDPQEADAETAERLARSVRARLRTGQPGTTRILAAASRASLRDPYTREVPNLWPARRRRLRLLPFGALVCALALTGSCGGGGVADRAPAPELPARIVPDAFDDVRFERRAAVEARVREAGPQALISAARVYTFSAEGAVQGSLQVGAFRRGISGLRQEVRRGVLEGIGAARFKLTRVGALRVYSATIGQQRFALWFAPEGGYYELLVQRRSFGDHLDLLARILEYQGRAVGRRDGGTLAPPPDPRRGEAIA